MCWVAPTWVTESVKPAASVNCKGLSNKGAEMGAIDPMMRKLYIALGKS